MGSIYQTEEYTIIDNTSISLDLDTNIEYFVIKGTVTLATGNYNITTSSTPTNAKTIYIWYKARATYSNNRTVSILGTTLTQEQALSDVLIIVKANGVDYDVILLKDSTDFYKFYKGVGQHTANLLGETKTLFPKIDKKTLVVTGTGTMGGGITITGNGDQEGDEFLIIYNATLNRDGNNFNIFGISLTDEQASTGDLSIHAVYDGVTWQTSFMAGDSLIPDKATQSEAETGTNNTNFMTPLRVAQKLTHWLVNTAKTTSVTWTFSNAVPINLSALTASQRLELDGSKNIISVAKATGDNKALGTTVGTVMEGNDSRVVNNEFILYASFESGEQGNISFKVQGSLVVTQSYIRVISTLSGTDSGTVEVSKGGGTITGGTQVIPASTSFSTNYTLPLSGANATFVNNDELTISTTKSTVGGKVIIVIRYTK